MGGLDQRGEHEAAHGRENIRAGWSRQGLRRGEGKRGKEVQNDGVPS